MEVAEKQREAKKQTPTKPIEYCLYARKSTESEERQVLSIDSQIKEMLQLAERESLQVVEIRRESHSAKETGKRPIFNELLDDVRVGKFTGILTWAPDRLSRNAGDLGSVVDLMDQGKLCEIRTYSQLFTNNPNEKFLLMILGSQAKLENDNRGINVKRGLRTRVEMGLWPTLAPIGYLNQKRMDKKCQVIVDSKRAPAIRKMFEKVGYDKWSGRKLYHWLKHDLNFYTRGNKPLSLSGIYRVLQNSFYAGTFEYPRDSGNWYQGTHKPLISQELFEKVQEQLKRDNIAREAREFAFTKLMVCGYCASGITAQEKYKKLRDGTTAKYIYYNCTRSQDRHCTNKYIREEELIRELLKLIDKVGINELGMKMKLEQELKRFSQFQEALGIKGKQSAKTDEVNLRTYAKYLLKEGSMLEKRELLANLRSKILYKDQTLTLVEE